MLRRHSDALKYARDLRRRVSTFVQFSWNVNGAEDESFPVQLRLASRRECDGEMAPPGYIQGRGGFDKQLHRHLGEQLPEVNVPGANKHPECFGVPGIDRKFTTV